MTTNQRSGSGDGGNSNSNGNLTSQLTTTKGQTDSQQPANDSEPRSEQTDSKPT
jgi:hypothetical protein